MIKTEKINDLTFKEEKTFKIMKGSEVVLKTADETVFNQRKEAAQKEEMSKSGNDIEVKLLEAEKEAVRRIATLLDEKIESEMGGNVSKLARLSGVTTVTIANLRKGEGMNPSLNILVRIFTALNVPLEGIFKA